jgi:hypothetical protein
MACQTMGTWWAFSESPLDPKSWATAGLWLLSFGWTLLVTGPMHAGLSQGDRPPAVKRLVWSCWVRTAAWFLQACLAAWWGLGFMAPGYSEGP